MTMPRSKLTREQRARSSNDPLEFSYGLEIAREQLAKTPGRDEWIEMIVPDALPTIFVQISDVKTAGPQLRFDFLATGSIVKSYFECPIVPKDLRGVVVGHREADLNEPVVKMLLREFGYSKRTRLTRGSSALRG